MGFVPAAAEFESIFKAQLIYTFAGAEPPKK